MSQKNPCFDVPCLAQSDQHYREEKTCQKNPLSDGQVHLADRKGKPTYARLNAVLLGQH
jgi:hypothetical protein